MSIPSRCPILSLPTPAVRSRTRCRAVDRRLCPRQRGCPIAVQSHFVHADTLTQASAPVSDQKIPNIIDRRQGRPCRQVSVHRRGMGGANQSCHGPFRLRFGLSTKSHHSRYTYSEPAGCGGADTKVGTVGQVELALPGGEIAARHGAGGPEPRLGSQVPEHRRTLGPGGHQSSAVG